MKLQPPALKRFSMDRFRGISFDLFGTILRLDEDRLPRIVIDEVEHRTLLAAPLKRLAEERPDVSLLDAVTAYLAAVEETSCRLAAIGGRELCPEWTFACCLDRLGLSDRHLARRLAARLMDATLDAAAPAADLTALLGALRGRGISLALVSNLADADGGKRLLERLDLKEFFKATIFSGDLGWRKPDGRIYRRAAEQLGHPPHALLHIGDEWEADIVGACNAGFAALWVREIEPDKPGDREALRCRLADFVKLVLDAKPPFQPGRSPTRQYWFGEPQRPIR